MKLDKHGFPGWLDQRASELAVLRGAGERQAQIQLALRDAFVAGKEYVIDKTAGALEKVVTILEKEKHR